MKMNLELVKEIISLPKAVINFIYDDKSEWDVKKTYRYFTKLHRYKIIKNKTIGVALIDLKKFNSFDDYLTTVNGKNSAAYYARKCVKRNYVFIEVNKNHYIDDIYEINTSAEFRQGRKMSDSYLQKQTQFDNQSNYKYFGVLDDNGKLVSYCDIGFYGEFCMINTLLGHKEHLNNGVMYLMITSLISYLYKNELTIHTGGLRYVVYDTFFGASNGLKKFKTKLGFEPYRVKWKLKKGSNV